MDFYSNDPDVPDERDETIEKLQSINEMLVKKVKDLEVIVQQTVGMYL